METKLKLVVDNTKIFGLKDMPFDTNKFDRYVFDDGSCVLINKNLDEFTKHRLLSESKKLREELE